MMRNETSPNGEMLQLTESVSNVISWIRSFSWFNLSSGTWPDIMARTDGSLNRSLMTARLFKSANLA